MSNYYDHQYGQNAQHAHHPAQPQHQQQSDAPSQESPSLGATFVPGGFDDYYMPEVFAPAPQRVMPEVPQNMQDGLQRMESGTAVSDNPPPAPAHAPASTASYPTPANGATNPTTASVLPFKSGSETGAVRSKPGFGVSESPNFSPFPKVKGENIPPSFEETEESLWNTKDHILHSNDVTMQLAWAKKVLAWVEVVMDDAIRELDGKQRPSTPKVEHQMRVDALTVVNHLAEQEHPDALFLRAKWLEFGKFGYRIDKREAYNGYKRAAELGLGRAEYRMGMLFESSNDMRNAIQHYNIGQGMGDSAASYRLGMMSLMGQHGQMKDYHEGLRSIEAAAESADEDAPQGAYVYGLLIARELPDINIPEGLLPYKLSDARRYIEKAALLGFAKAQLKMGQAYELCQLGCDFNPSFSLHYYGLAAKQGQAEAALGVSRWFLFGYEGFFNKNEQLAFKYAKQAANAKLATGEFAMGYYHEIGIHVPKDIREAKRWYDMAAENGNKDAVGRLESLNEQKHLTKSDHETTTLTRIKSQHGSMRGKRPERFANKPAAMPAVSEGEVEPPKASPGLSPGHPPGGMPDMSRLSVGDNRAPAFALNVNAGAGMPKPMVPYPEDGRPVPLNVNRPQSAAPYPADGNMRPSQGPSADRPMSAFGIRPLSSGTGGHPSQPGHPGGRNPSAGWEPQVPGNYGRSGPGHATGGYRDPYRQDAPRPATTQPYDVAQMSGGLGHPAQGRPQQNLNQRPASSMSGMTGQYPHGGREAAAQPGRDYGPRTSSRPSLSPQPQQGQGHRPVSEAYGRGMRPERLSSLQPHPSHSGQRPVSHVDHARHTLTDDGPGRTGSAPPARPPPKKPASPAASTVSAPPRPTGQGPSTFEEMGIAPGKSESECLVM